MPLRSSRRPIVDTDDPMRKPPALLDHGCGEIDGIDPPRELDHAPGKIAGAGPDVQDAAGLIGEQARQDGKHLIGIRGPGPVRVDDPPVFEGVRVKGASIPWFRLHL